MRYPISWLAKACSSIFKLLFLAFLFGTITNHRLTQSVVRNVENMLQPFSLFCNHHAIREWVWRRRWWWCVYTKRKKNLAAPPLRLICRGMHLNKLSPLVTIYSKAQFGFFLGWIKYICFLGLIMQSYLLVVKLIKSAYKASTSVTTYYTKSVSVCSTTYWTAVCIHLRSLCIRAVKQGTRP